MSDYDDNDVPNEDDSRQNAVFRDELKRKKADENKLRKTLETVNNFLTAMLHQPEYWKNPEARTIRDFVYTVSHDPRHFPPSLPAADGITDESTNSDDPPNLTKGFVESVYSGDICDNMDVDDDYVPTVVVTLIDTKHGPVDLGGLFLNQEKRYVLRVADGDGNVVTVRIGTQLNSRMGLVKVGSLLKLHCFRRGFLKPIDEDNQERLALLVWNFDTCGTMHVDDELAEKEPNLSINHPNDCELEGSSDDEGYDTDIDDVPVDDGSDDDEDGEYMTWRDAKCTAEKRLCCSNGFEFDVCVTEAFPISDIDLEEIAQDCWFVTKKVKKMLPNEKRNVLYWWFMVNVYHVRGRNKRKHPPLCLIKAIRTAFPNEDGVPYIDFRRSPSRSRKRKSH